MNNLDKNCKICDFEKKDEINLEKCAELISEDIKELQKKDNQYWKNRITPEYVKIVTISKKIESIINLVYKVAQSHANTLIKGETGTGKESIARAIHFYSPDREEPFIGVNCAALSESLLESELFGHVKGAFTGAIANKKGKFELAGRGTIFLDEIGDTSLEFQAKLLRVLQEHEFFKVGGELPIKSEARVIAATNRDLSLLMKESKFREDLFYRINIIPIELPPLRERKDDILLLAKYFLKQKSQEYKLGYEKQLTKNAEEMLCKYSWPGNVRELENAIEHAFMIGRGSRKLYNNHFPSYIVGCESPFEQESDANVTTDTNFLSTYEDFEKYYLGMLLKKASGNISEVSRISKLGRATVKRKLIKCGLL
jgi:transcriptional regulator with GAF, ATPase, and Fis domain